MDEIEINNGRIVKKGDKVLFYDDHKSYSWVNGFKIIDNIRPNGMIDAFDVGDNYFGVTSYGTDYLY